MPEFTQSWGFWFVLGIIIGFAFGFALAIIIAGCGKGSRMEETLTFNSKDVQSYKDFDDAKDTYGIVSKMGKVKNHFKPKEEIVTQNNPRTD